jgi:glycosyltransferase involved in cell wall biosynthesis
MKILVLSARFPEPRSRGDQSRVFGHISYLAKSHDLTVVTGEHPSGPEALARLCALAEVRVVASTLFHRARSALWSLTRGRPAQVGWMMPHRSWHAASKSADEVDVVLANTVRSVAGPLSRPLIVDYVDALSANMLIRAAGPEPLPVRAVARLESRLLRRWELRVAAWADGAVATSSADAASLPACPRVEVLPVAWDGEIVIGEDRRRRDIDVILTGNMGYPPNALAARVLASEIAPALRRARPETTIYVVGRRAKRLDLSGVTVKSDVPDVTSYLRRAKVAVAPLEGTGSPYKVLEAAASGAAIVASPFALGAYGMPGIEAVSPDEFVSGAIALLTDERRRRELVAQSVPVLQAHTLTALGRRLEGVLAAVAQ